MQIKKKKEKHRPSHGCAVQQWDPPPPFFDVGPRVLRKKKAARSFREKKKGETRGVQTLESSKEVEPAANQRSLRNSPTNLC